MEFMNVMPFLRYCSLLKEGLKEIEIRMSNRRAEMKLFHQTFALNQFLITAMFLLSLNQLLGSETGEWIFLLCPFSPSFQVWSWCGA